MSLQLRRAHALASAHGHEWACALPVEVAEALWALGGAVEIRRVVDAMRHEDAIGGIEAPAVNGAGVIHHTTGTGRLRWEVYPDGYTRLTVSRPSGDILCASVDTGDAVEVLWTNGVFFKRHVDVPAAALRAVLGATEPYPVKVFAAVDAALAEARAGVTPEVEVICLDSNRPGDVTAPGAVDLDRLSPVEQVEAIRAATKTGGLFFGAHYEHAVYALALAVSEGFPAAQAVIWTPGNVRVHLDDDGSFLDPWPGDDLGALRRALLRGLWAAERPGGEVVIRRPG